MWAGAIPWRRCISADWPPRFRTFPLAEGPRSSFLAGESCPASKRSLTRAKHRVHRDKSTEAAEEPKKMSQAKRRRVIAGNWKMYKTQAETRAFFSAFLPLASGARRCDIVIAPPVTAICTAGEATRGSNISIGAQDVLWGKDGAFTGGTAPPMLVDAGCPR